MCVLCGRNQDLIIKYLLHLNTFLYLLVPVTTLKSVMRGSTQHRQQSFKCFCIKSGFNRDLGHMHQKEFITPPPPFIMYQLFTKSSQKSNNQKIHKIDLQSINTITLIIQILQFRVSNRMHSVSFMFISDHACSQISFSMSVFFGILLFQNLFVSFSVYFYLNCRLAKLSIFSHQF